MGSVYVHFPYCLAKCPYCDFTSYAKPRDAIDHAGYADAVLEELSVRARPLHARAASGLPFRVDTLFFGGGTPSLWEPSELGRVLAGIRSTFSCADDLEITVECNPTSLDVERARALFSVGVNRLSIGTQSLDRAELGFLGRLHDPDGALASVRGALTLAEEGLRVSSDLIFGLPDQAPEAAAEQAGRLADLGLRHVSAYQLTIEPGTRFGELAKVGRLPLADDGRVAEAFLAVDEALASRGLRHYEISNFAAPGHEARHNLGYWRGDEYLGLGCGAVGALVTANEPHHALRYRNPVDPGTYTKRARDASTTNDREGLDPLSDETEVLDPETRLKERIMLGLRLADGFDLERAGRDLGVTGFTEARTRAVERLVERGRLLRDRGLLTVPRAAWLFTDDTAARLF
jgi:oxygen-independent coproporphyrinogen-3 oxidase